MYCVQFFKILYCIGIVLYWPNTFENCIVYCIVKENAKSPVLDHVILIRRWLPTIQIFLRAFFRPAPWCLGTACQVSKAAVFIRVKPIPWKPWTASNHILTEWLSDLANYYKSWCRTASNLTNRSVLWWNRLLCSGNLTKAKVLCMIYTP